MKWSPRTTKRTSSTRTSGARSRSLWSTIVQLISGGWWTETNGWGAPTWPVEYGGTGWDARQQILFEEVLAETGCPLQFHHGLRHIGPILIEFGSEYLKSRYLPGILDGTEWWCQGYSEPEAGSDLAALKTSATREGDVYVVSGQKTWTSYAREADLMYALVRTSKEGRKQLGITLLVVPMTSEGLTVHRIRTIDGWDHVNDVFFNEVRVPVENCVGVEGLGWTYGKRLLENERLNAANTAHLFSLLAHARRLVSDRLQSPVLEGRREELELRLLHIEAELMGQRECGARAVDDAMHGRDLGLTPSVLKLATSQLFQRLWEICFDIEGPELARRLPLYDENSGLSDGSEGLRTYLWSRSRSIVGGTSEIQRNVIARGLFGA